MPSENFSQFVSKKPRRIRWSNAKNYDGQTRVGPQNFATGSWDEGIQNYVTTWEDLQGSETEMEDVCFRRFRQSAVFPVDGDVEDLIFNDSKIVVATSKGDIELIGEAAEKRFQKIHCWSRVHHLGAQSCACTALSLWGNEMVSVGEDGGVRWLDLDTSQELSDHVSATGTNNCALYSVSHVARQQVCAGSAAGELLVCDRRAGEVACVATVGAGAVCSLAVHPSQPHLIGVGNFSGAVCFSDLRVPSGPVSSDLSVHTGPVWEIRFHPIFPDNLFTCSSDGSLLHWDASQLQRTWLASSSSSAWLGGESLGSELRVDNLLGGQVLAVNSFDLSGDRLLAAADNFSIHLVEPLYLK